MTSAAVPVKKHPLKFFNSSNFIFLSITLIFSFFAKSIIVKIKTFLQMFSISILLAGNSGNELLFGYGMQIGIILLWGSAILTLYTGYDYLKKGIDHAID